MNIRKAVKTDAPELAHLINIAGEGMPEYLWSGMAENGDTAMDTGIKRAGRDEGGFSYRNATVADLDGRVAGMVLDYLQPDPYDAGDIDTLPGVVRPLIELEAMEAGSWYVNAIAIHEPYRRRGLATALLALSETSALMAGTDRISIIVAARNKTAYNLYASRGYRERASKPIVPYPGCRHGGDWLLMVKHLNA